LKLSSHPKQVQVPTVFNLRGVAALLDAIKNVVISPIPWNNPGPDPEVNVATLAGLKWFSTESSHLFVRKPYERLWQHVLFETRAKRYFFNGTTVESESLLLNERALARYRNDRHVLILHDHLPGNEPPLVFDGGFVVASVSPDPKNYHEFVKHDALSLWMPLPTTDELMAMNSIEPQLTESELPRRIATYGPIPRTVFASDQRACLARLIGKIMSFELGRNFLHMLSNAELPENKHGLSWWVVHVDATEDLRQVSTIRWASVTCLIKSSPKR
jgi:hypothetical protein